MEKRDRNVELLLHRSSGAVLLFPYICYMAGRACGHGSAVALEGSESQDPKILGTQIVRLLKSLKSADIDALSRKQQERLEAMWRGDELPEIAPTDDTWSQIREAYPALLKGPATYLRQFSVANITERDTWKSRKLVRVIPSKERGTTEDGDECRFPVKTSAAALGRRVLEFLAD